MQAAVNRPTLDPAEAARRGKGAMAALKGEGIGVGKPGEPSRGVGSERKNAFVRVDHLIATIGGEGNHGNGTRAGRGGGEASRVGGRAATVGAGALDGGEARGGSRTEENWRSACERRVTCSCKVKICCI